MIWKKDEKYANFTKWFECPSTFSTREMLIPLADLFCLKHTMNISNQQIEVLQQSKETQPLK